VKNSERANVVKLCDNIYLGDAPLKDKFPKLYMNLIIKYSLTYVLLVFFVQAERVWERYIFSCFGCRSVM